MLRPSVDASVKGNVAKEEQLDIGFHHHRAENLRPPSIEMVRASSTLLKMPPLLYCIGHDVIQLLLFEDSHGDGLRSCAH